MTSDTPEQVIKTTLKITPEEMETDAAQAESEISAAQSRASGETNWPILLGVIACFILSGFAALLYQTAWMRQFSVTFGTSELAVAAVLAAYMGGLALGSNLAARFIHKVKRPVLFYGVLEFGIAIAALMVPLFLKLANVTYIGIFGGQSLPVDASGLGQSFFYLIVAFLVLVIPTAMMGATLPLLTKYVVKSKEQIGSRVGLLYATNTLGAIGGTLFAGFILLPRMGLMATILWGVAINILVFVIAALIARKIGKLAHDELVAQNGAEATAKTATSQKLAGIPREMWILPVMLMSGANSFVYEVLWTRLLGHVLGGSITAFSTMLAGFLSGIAIGSAIASRFAKTRAQATAWFVVVQIGIAVMSIAIYQLLPSALPDEAGLKGNAGLAFLVLLPATIFIGATFPLAVRVLARDETDAPQSSARVYSWNTVGAILGATVAAFFIIPLLKYEGAIKAAVIVNVLLAVIAAMFLTRPKPRMAAIAASLVAALGIGVFYKPQMPEAILRSSPVYAMPNGNIEFYEVGRSATVLIIENGGYYNVRTNGLPEASTTLKGAPPSRHNQHLLSTMPVIARPDIEDMLIIGFGGGNAVEGVPSSVKTVDVVEIEKEVIAANESIGDKRRVDPLKDPRVNVVINDARSAMMLTDKKYGGIVSQPSHPWTAGASHLYTKEFMELAETRLTRDGVYLQWMNTQFIDEQLFKDLCATMLDVYTYVRVYEWHNEVIFFLGSNAPLDIELQMARTGAPLVGNEFEYMEKGIGSVEDVAMAMIMDQDNVEAFAREGRLITDNRNYMATQSALAMDKGTVLRSREVFEVVKAYDPLMQADSKIRTELRGRLNFPYMAQRLEAIRKKPRGVALADALLASGDSQALTMIGLGLEQQGQREQSQQNIRVALEKNPNDEQARYALIKPYIGQILAEEAVPGYIVEQVKLLKGSAAAALAGSKAAFVDDLQAIAQLDSVLAQANPSDLWYGTVLKLRAQWRVRVTTPTLQPRLANEATQLIDTAVTVGSDPTLVVLRMQSTLMSKDYDAAYQSGLTFANNLASEIDTIDNWGGDVEVGFKRNRLSGLEAVQDMATEIAASGRLEEAEADSLLRKLTALERRLGTFP